MSDYRYDAIVRAIHDGDTITCDMDLGFDNWIHGMKLRLYGLNAPELVTPDGKKAQVFLAAIIPIGLPVIIETVKDKQEKYGRWLATIFRKPEAPHAATVSVPGSVWNGLALPPIAADGTISVNELLLKCGFAKPYFGVGPKPV